MPSSSVWWEGAGRGARLYLEPERARSLPGRRELFKATMKPLWHTLGVTLQWAGCAWLSVWLISFNTVRDWGTPGWRGRSCYLLRGSEVSSSWIDYEIPNQLRKHTNRNARLRTNAHAEIRTQPYENQRIIISFCRALFLSDEVLHARETGDFGGGESTVSQGQMGNTESVNSWSQPEQQQQQQFLLWTTFSWVHLSLTPHPASPAAVPRQRRWMFESAKSLKALL